MRPALHRYVTRQADVDASALALAMDGEQWTYGELERASNRLANLLKAEGCRPGDRVALFVAKSPLAIVAMLAALKADAVYVPIDVSSPTARVGRILGIAEPAFLVLDASGASLVEALGALGALDGIRIGAIGDPPVMSSRVPVVFSQSDWLACSDALPRTRRGGRDPAHLLFTSGSTGLPKGVAVTHASVDAFVAWALRYFGIGRSDRVSGHPPLFFDLSTFDIYGALAAGASLHLFPPPSNLLPTGVATFIRSEGLTQWFSVPSVLTYLVQHAVIEQDDFPTLRRLLWCGEAMPTPTLIALMERLPHVTFTNLYGPTEATIASSYHTVTTMPASPNEPIPIGVPCEGEELLVLDEGMQPVSPGAVGEIYIGGVGLSPGYWRDEERTAQAFRRHPFKAGPEARLYRTGDLGRTDGTGLLYCLGRTDSQIKSRGYRIELGEIEAALNALEAVDEAAVVAVESGGFEGQAICCAYVAAVDLPPTMLRSLLARDLPRYMLPMRFRRFGQLPTNANGKVDRPELRRRFQEET